MRRFKKSCLRKSVEWLSGQAAEHGAEDFQLACLDQREGSRFQHTAHFDGSLWDERDCLQHGEHAVGGETACGRHAEVLEGAAIVVLQNLIPVGIELLVEPL